MDHAAGGTRYIAGYLVSAPLAAVAATAYGLVALLLWTHYARNGRKYMLTCCIGAVGMTIGYAIRLFSHWHPDSVAIYSAMTLFILVSPCLFLALDYMILSRLAVHIDASDALPIRASRLAKIFVTADIITFIAQLGAGGLLGLAASKPKLADIGTKAMVGALAIQAACFIGFTIILMVWGRRVNSRHPEKWHFSGRSRQSSANPFSKRPNQDWRILYHAVLVTCVLYIIRSAYRVAEFVGGHDSSIAKNEALLYLLDALPVFLAISIFICIWPVRFLDDVEEGEASAGKMHIPLSGSVDGYYAEHLLYPQSQSRGEY